MSSPKHNEQKEQSIESNANTIYRELLAELYEKRNYFINKAIDPDKANDETYKAEKNEKAFLINNIERQLRDKYKDKTVVPEEFKSDLQAIKRDRSYRPLIASSGFLGAVRTSEMELLFNRYIDKAEEIIALRNAPSA